MVTDVVLKRERKVRQRHAQQAWLRILARVIVTLCVYETARRLLWPGHHPSGLWELFFNLLVILGAQGLLWLVNFGNR